MNVFLPDRTFDCLVTSYGDAIEKFRLHNSSREGVRFVDNPDDANIIILFEEFSFKLESYIDELSCSQLVQKYADKIYTINYDDYGRGFLAGCYTSLNTNNFDERYHRACAYPKTYNEFVNSDYENVTPAYLFSFRGTIKSHPCREDIYSKFSDHTRGSVHFIDQDFHTHGVDQKKQYVEDILNSKFVLCPRGWSPSTYRLFEVMSLGRCPVIISDEWIEPDNVPWESCSIRISEENIHRIPEILEEREGEWQELGVSAKRVFSEHFAEPKRFQHYFDMILDIHQSQSLGVVADPYSAMLKRWKSWNFRWENGWTLPQKILRRIDRVRAMEFR